MTPEEFQAFYPKSSLDSPYIGGSRKECQVGSFGGVRAFAFVLQP